MLRLLTTCEECIHNKICKIKDSPKEMYNKLYSDDVYNGDDYEVLVFNPNVDINISCKAFKKEMPVSRDDLNIY